MKVLVVGSGGREHALVWKIAQSELVQKVFCAPGNAGISQIAECIDIKSDDIVGLCKFAVKEKIDLTVVGPEAALANGIVDTFEKSGLKIFGPTREAAQLEASKVFAKDLMIMAGVPTAKYKVFDSSQIDNAYDFVMSRYGVGFDGLVIKAEGLASGKGVIVAQRQEEAQKALKTILFDKKFGDSGNRVIIEDCLYGQEASILAFSDGKNIALMASSQDHKRIFDNDKGPNTGGMGAYSPAPCVTKNILQDTVKRVFMPIIKEMNSRNIPYKGILYAGLILTKEGPKVLEFNVRFGDPETQAILPRLKSDLVEVMLATIEGKLDKINLEWSDKTCVCVVVASAGYPGEYEKGKVISGLDEADSIDDVVVFHAGTKKATINGRSAIVTDAGRVLGVTGLGKTARDAVVRTYQGISKINFPGMQYRRDIAAKAL